MRRLLTFAADHPWPVILLLLLVTALAATRLDRLEFHISAEGMMLEDDPERELYREASATFGGSEGVMLYLQDPGLLERPRLEAIQAALGRIEALPFVAGTTSLFNVRNVRSVDGEIRVGGYLEPLPEGAAGREALLKAALRNPLVAELLLSRSGQAMVVGVQFKEGGDGPDFDRRAVAALEQAVAPLAGQVETLFQVGSPVVRQAVTEKIRADQRLILPASLAALLLMLALLLRRLDAALLPLATAGVSVVWTLALMAQLGIAVNVMTSIVPALLVIVGSTEDIHLLSDYYRGVDGGLSPQRALRRMAAQLGTAILLTFLTTALGFLSIAANPIALLREFGLVAAAGLACNFLVTSLLLPAWLGLTGGRQRAVRRRRRGRWLQRLVLALHRRSAAHPRLLAGLAVAVVAVSLAGATRIQVDNDPLSYFPPDSELHRHLAAVQTEMAGVQSFEILIDGQIEGTFLKARYLRELERVQRFLADDGRFDKSVSFADVMALVNVVMEEDDSGRLYLPEEDFQIQEYMLFLRHEQVAAYVSPDYSRARIVVRHGITASHRLEAALATVRQWLAAELPRGLHATVTGEAVLTNRAADSMAAGQGASLGLMVAAIWLVVAALFVNAKAGLLAVVPNLFPVVVLFGVMGFAGIPLDTGTAMVAAIALGISVDDTMHFMVRYHHHSRRLPDPGRALRATVREEATPIATTSLALAAGFGVLALSGFPPVVHFGLLSALVMVAALLATFLLTPLLLANVRLVGLWDLLGLQLLDRVRHHCTLFHGMRTWQIKKLILVSEVRELAAGEPLIEQGQQGEEMFVLLEGEVEIWSRHPDGRRQSRARLGPGEVIGEIALVTGAPRTANVTAREPSRLLVLRWSGIRRIARLFPPISSKLFQNLAGILGQRLAASAAGEVPLLDPATGAYSGAFFDAQLELERERARRYGEPLTMISVTVAGLERQPPGADPDAALQALSRTALASLRRTDVFARWQANRFLLLLPRTGVAGAEIVAGRIGAALREPPFDGDGALAAEVAVEAIHPGGESRRE